MTETGEPSPPFDERAALAELERFRQEIERYRVIRQTAGQEFDRFIESFPAPEEVFPAEGTSTRDVTPEAAPVRLPPIPRRQSADAVPAGDSSIGPAPVQASRVVPPLDTEAFPQSIPERTPKHTSQPTAPLPAKRKSIRVAIVVGVLAAAGAFATWSFRQPRPQSAIPSPSGTEPSRESPAAPPAAVPAAAPAAPVAPVESEITTVRRAWVRVIADGERVVERELEADARISFKAEKTILIRTGDAGAVKLSIRGDDKGTLGQDGAVVTRSFDVPPHPPR
jgi:hypothetical protein